MDAQLRDVPVPPDLVDRLKAGRAPSDEEIDARLRDVSVPAHLERHLRRIAWQSRYPSLWGRFALAASVLIVLASGAYFALVRGIAEPEQRVVAKKTAPAATTESPRLAAPSPKAGRESKAAPRRQEPITVPLGPSQQVAEEQTKKLSGTLENVATVGSSIKQAIEARLRAQAALGASAKFQQLPELAAYEPQPARGVTPPRLRGYDLLFQLRHGEHPFVPTTAHKDLRTSRLPLTFRTSSYDQAVASIAAGKLPGAEEIRVEDFLAAQRYALPAAPVGGLALHAAASPSPLGESAQHLLQLIVQGGATRAAPHRPARLIAIVDTSSAMQFDARSKTVQRALETFARRLAADDRMTLIAFAEQPRVLAEDAMRDDLEELLASGILRQTAGTADLGSAIQSACDAVRAVETSQPRQVVFVTAGRSEFDDAQLASASQSLLQLVAANTAWQIVRVLPTDDDPRYSDLARRAQGRASAVTSADELAALFVESLTGREQIVADGMSIRITFNPAVVISYRLLGHETSTLTGQSGDPLEVDLQAGQTVTGMYELWLKPAGSGDVAIVEMLWHDPASGQPRRSVQPIRQSQVASSFAQAPPWLQQGILAASAAEFLRGSYFVPNSRRIGQLLDVADKADARAAERPEFQVLVRLIAAASKLR
jgi:Ca-activated chloride channel homolog